MIPLKWGNTRNCGVCLKWDLKEDSVAAFYRIELSSALADSLAVSPSGSMSGSRDLALSFLAGDKLERDEDSLKFCSFSVLLEMRDSSEQRIRVEDYLRLQPPLGPEVFKTGWFRKDPGAEMMMQYVALEIENLDLAALKALVFEFKPGTRGELWLDRIAFSGL